METRKRAWPGRLRYPRLKTVLEGDEGDERPLEWQPRLRHAVAAHAPPLESSARSASASSRDKPTHRPDDGRAPEGSSSNRPPDAYVGGSAQRQGRLSSGDATAQSTSSDASACAQTRPPEQSQVHVDSRPVRGVVTVQAFPSPTAGAISVLLVVSRGTLVLQTLQKPYKKLLEMPLDDVAAKVVPGLETMLHVTDSGSIVDGEDRDSDPGVEGIFVVLRDCSLRDQWLKALATCGARVDVAGACLTESTDATSSRYPDAPVRWMR